MAKTGWGALAGAVVAAAIAAGPGEAQRFDWDEIGREFCRRAVAGDLGGMGPILSRELAALIASAGRRAEVPPRLLLQAYDAEAPGCEVRTRNAAIVEVRRAVAGGSPAWTDYLVMVPEADGSTRIDDILFATRRSDTLRSRLQALLTGG